MSDSRRVYSAIKRAVKQLYPHAPQGNAARHLNTLAAMVTGIVLSKSCQLPQLASKVPNGIQPESQVKHFSRWTQNEHVDSELCFLPFAQALVESLARQQEQLVFMMDGSEVGRGCLTLLVSVLYQHRALPVAWVVIQGKKGHFPAQTHVALLQTVSGLVPEGTPAVFLGDGEFDSIQLQEAIQSQGWVYVCRTAKNIRVEVDGAWCDLEAMAVCRGRKKLWKQVRFTLEAYGPVQVLAWWDSRYADPLYLVSNLTDRDQICTWYRKRSHIETFFSDQKSRGFHLQRSHLSDPARIHRLMFAACLAYIWIIYLGALALNQDWHLRIHRTDRCDLSLFQLGLRLLDYLLNQDRPIPIAFLPQPRSSQMITAKSVR